RRHLRKRSPVDEIRIAETFEPGHVVVNRVIDSALIGSTEAEVQARYTGVIDEGNVVRTRAECTEMEFARLARIGRSVGRWTGRIRGILPSRARYFEQGLA